MTGQRQKQGGCQDGRHASSRCAGQPKKVLSKQKYDAARQSVEENVREVIADRIQAPDMVIEEIRQGRARPQKLAVSPFSP